METETIKKSNIIEGYKLKNPLIDWNKKLEEDLGDRELTEEEGKKTLGKFLMYNLRFFASTVIGFTLAPYQRLILKGWFTSNFILCVAGRGAAKSTLASVFSALYCLMHPDHKILIVSTTFRSSRQIVEKIDAWSKKREGFLLRQCMDGDMIKKADLFRIKFLNGAEITCVPLGDPNKLRGFRCHVLFIDEGLLIAQSTIDNVLKPFLVAGADIDTKMLIREKEERLIKKGLLKQEDRTIFESGAKLIILSSASYTWEHLHTIYQDYLKKIYAAEELDESNQYARYAVQQLSYEIVPKEILDPAVTEDITNGSNSKDTIDREYKAFFTSSSDSYFSAKKITECMIPDKEEPSLEIIGDPKSEYILAIDPNVSSSPSADHFAICVMKIIKNKDNKEMGMVVNQYGVAGVELKYHIQYFLYLLQNFNIVYIACDTTSGDNLDFINICNESKQFKDQKIELLPINAEFGKENFDEITQQVKKGYDKNTKRIVQKQPFHSAFQRAANEYLQSCFNFKNIRLGSKILSLGDKSASLANIEIGDVWRDHPQFADREIDGENSMYNFIEYQDNMLKMVQDECVSVEVKTNSLGTTSYDLPQSMKRSKNAKRRRKDNYSALLLCNWCIKIYLETKTLPENPEDELGMAFFIR